MSRGDKRSSSGEAESDRGKRASFDRKTGEVRGSGAGAGNPEGSSEDYDSDLGSGSGGDHRDGEPGNAA